MRKLYKINFLILFTLGISNFIDSSKEMKDAEKENKLSEYIPVYDIAKIINNYNDIWALDKQFGVRGVKNITCSHNGKYLAYGDNNVLNLYDISSSKIVFSSQKVDVGNYHITSIAFSPDGKYVAAGIYFLGFKILDIESKKIKYFPDNCFMPQFSGTRALKFSPNGESLCVASSSVEDHRIGVIYIYNLSLGNVKDKICIPNTRIVSITYSHDGKRIAAGYEDGYIRVFDLGLKSVQVQEVKGYNSEVNAIVYSPNGIHFATGSKDDKKIKIWDNQSLKLLYTIDNDEGITSLAYSSDGHNIASGQYYSKEYYIKIWRYEGIF